MTSDDIDELSAELARIPKLLEERASLLRGALELLKQLELLERERGSIPPGSVAKHRLRIALALNKCECGSISRRLACRISEAIGDGGAR